jgi:hypothetical protein
MKDWWLAALARLRCLQGLLPAEEGPQAPRATADVPCAAWTPPPALACLELLPRFPAP